MTLPPWKLFFGWLVVLLSGCLPASPPQMNLGQAKPKLDMRLVRYDRTGLSVDEHSAAGAHVFADDWTILLSPLGKEEIQIFAPIYESGSGQPDSPQSLDPLTVTAKRLIAYRYVTGIENDRLAERCTYLINLDDHWILGSCGSRDYERPFPLAEADRLVESLTLCDQPQEDMLVLPAWQDYQQSRTAGTPIAKFMISLDPAPIGIGNYSHYDSILRTESPTVLPLDSDYERGGRTIGKDIIEFYALGDPISVRVDIWDADFPEPGPTHKGIFQGPLDLAKPKLDVWSTHAPLSVDLSSGQYDVQIYIVNEGEGREEYLSNREHFQRDDLERYEIFLKRREEAD